MNLPFRSSPLIWPLKCASNSDILRPVAGTTARISAPVGKGTESSGTVETGAIVSDCFSKVSARHKEARTSYLGGEIQRSKDTVGRAEERKEEKYRDSPPDYLLFQVLWEAQQLWHWALRGCRFGYLVAFHSCSACPAST